MMQVPPEFRKKIRKKAGEKDKSMYQLLKDMTKDIFVEERNERKKKPIFRF